MTDPVFIIGAQRSGTTLLRLLLNSGPDVSIPEEGTFLMPLLRTCRNRNVVLSRKKIRKFMDYLDRNSQFQLWGINTARVREQLHDCLEVDVQQIISLLYEEYARQECKVGWGDKTPSFFRMIPILTNLFPNAKFVHIIRDGRDLYLSWKKMDATKRNPSVTALEWIYKVKRAKNDMQRYAPTNFIEVRYEDLVCNPKVILKTICGFCNLKYKDSMFEYWKKSDKYIGKHHSDLIFTGVSKESIGKWKQVDEKEIKRIRYFEIIAGDLLRKYDYYIPKREIEYADKLRAYVQLMFGLPQRAFQVLTTRVILGLALKFGKATTASGGNH